MKNLKSKIVLTMSLALIAFTSAYASSSCSQIDLSNGTYLLTTPALPGAPRFVTPKKVSMELTVLKKISSTSSLKSVSKVFSIKTKSEIDGLNSFNFAFLSEQKDIGCLMYLVTDRMGFNWNSIWARPVLYYAISQNPASPGNFDLKEGYDDFKKNSSTLVKIK